MPLLAGYIGDAMLKAARPSSVFTSPSLNQMLPAADAKHSGTNFLFVVNNYAGGVTNFELAADVHKKCQPKAHWASAVHTPILRWNRSGFLIASYQHVDYIKIIYLK